MNRDIVKNLEDSFNRVSIIARYILMTYINAKEIVPDDIFYYVGSEGSKIIYGKSQLSITTISRKQLRSLIREKFGKEQKGSVTTALQCLDKDKISSWIIKLRDECIEAFKLCKMCQDLETYIDALNNLYMKGHIMLRLSDLRFSIPTKTYSGYETHEILFILVELFPAVFRLMYENIDIHEYITKYFEQLREIAKTRREERSLLIKIYNVTLEKLGATIDMLKFIILSAPIKYKIPLSIFYQALEISYWKYLAKEYKQKGGVIPMVSLQSLIPYIEEELKKYGYLLPTLSEIFRIVKEIEINEYNEYGRSFIHVGIPEYLGPEVPIPIRFYKPRHVDIKDIIKNFGIPLSELQRFWDLT